MKVLIVSLAVVVLLTAAALALLRVDCEACGGSGQIAQPHVVERRCTHCGGRGIDPSAPKRAPDGVRRIGQARPKCLYCRGTGTEHVTVPGGPCPVCGGKGSVPLYRWLLDRFT